MEYKFIEDPGHGWLAVSLHELSELGIIGKITSYSYVSADFQTIYLEEDCDMTTFLYAKFPNLERDAFEAAVRSFLDNAVETEYQEHTFVRRLAKYALTEEAAA